MLIKIICFVWVSISFIVFIKKDLIAPEDTEIKRNESIKCKGRRKHYLLALPNLTLTTVCIFYSSSYIKFRSLWLTIACIFLISSIATLYSVFKQIRIRININNYNDVKDLNKTKIRRIAGILYLITLIFWFYSWYDIVYKLILCVES